RPRASIKCSYRDNDLCITARRPVRGPHNAGGMAPPRSAAACVQNPARSCAAPSRKIFPSKDTDAFAHTMALRQLHLKRRTFAERRLDPNAAAVHLHNLLGNGEPQPRAALGFVLELSAWRRCSQ